ncbi:MAG: tetraacyldisaccharide 4'-kinase [Gammaproteobacteria bacterium]|jgi:tetraacyldisaccharide 4'-kinase
MSEQRFIDRIWYGNHPISIILLPFSWLYCICVKIRNLAYLIGLLQKESVNVPVIVVGNITVGGAGKTPLVIWLCHKLMEQGYKPGILSRGYGGTTTKWPQQVRVDSDPYSVGDEAVLLAQRTGRPVVVSPNRYLAAIQLLEYTECNVLLCDDGLQHLSLERDLEIAVIDGDRRFGNGNCLPAGPMREPKSRLSSVDLIVAKHRAGKNEHLMQYKYKDMISVNNANNNIQPSSFNNMTIHAVSGIANPERFHAFLKQQGMILIKHVFLDHHKYKLQDLQFDDEFPIVMTEKDAVKCKRFSIENSWYLPIYVEFNEVFNHRITKLVREVCNG